MHCRDIVERRIQEAQKEGQFDDLPGKGKPLDLRENPFVKSEWRLAHRLLRNAGFTLDWIELATSIRVESAQCQKLLEDQLTWANKAISSKDHTEDIEADVEDLYRWTVANYTERAKKVNKQIELFNLMVPLVHLQKHKVRIDEALLKFQESWPQITKESGEDSLAPSPCPTLDAPIGEQASTRRWRAITHGKQRGTS